jgi:hypothetical protein
VNTSGRNDERQGIASLNGKVVQLSSHSNDVFKGERETQASFHEIFFKRSAADVSRRGLRGKAAEHPRV